MIQLTSNCALESTYSEWTSQYSVNLFKANNLKSALFVIEATSLQSGVSGGLIRGAEITGRRLDLAYPYGKLFL